VHQSLVDLIHLVAGIHLCDRARPGTGQRGFRVVAFADAKLEIVQLDQARLRTEVRGGFQGMTEQMIRTGKARVRAVHCRR
jgi:hypothetical protein